VSDPSPDVFSDEGPAGGGEAAQNVLQLDGEEPGLSTDVKKEEAPLWRDLSGCRTEIGGVLFLLNLLRLIELPQCFVNLSDHISGWGLAELLGKAMLGPLNQNFRADPLWPILATLDGRSHGEVPAAHLPGFAAYRIPVQWLKRFSGSDDRWLLSPTPDRLKLLHSRGFIIVDCPLGTESAGEQAATELERYWADGISPLLEMRPDVSFDQCSTGSMRSSLCSIPEWAELPASLRQWMDWTFPYLRRLLARALGDQASTADEFAQLLFIKTGTLYCTATHVDLAMSMDQIALPVRRAGLDANPGWQRDLMRVVSFHFE